MSDDTRFDMTSEGYASLAATPEGRCLDMIKTFIDRNQYGPTIRELAQLLGYDATSTVWAVLATLQEWEIITRDPDKARSIQVANSSFFARRDVCQLTKESALMGPYEIRWQWNEGAQRVEEVC